MEDNLSRHAYMIMAHHRADLLQLLISALDDERNDIIVHIDKKSDLSEEQFHTNHAKLYFSERMNVNWGGYTQIECECLLMKNAVNIGHHSYYHFLTGANYPLWNQDYIHDFFEKYAGVEYIGFDNACDYTLRAMYYIPFSEHGKLKGISGRFIKYYRDISLALQKIKKINRVEGTNLQIKKGCAYFSITEGLVNEILKQEKLIKDLFFKTVCCDEVFVQTIAYNSKYRERLNNLDDEYDGCLREFAWPSNLSGDHPGWNFSMNDFDYLMSSKRLFAMKFESPDGVDVINAIKERRNIS